MTPDEVLSLPVVVDVPTAGRALGIGSTLAYELAKAGRLGVPVLKVGRLYKVPRAGLLEVLGIPDMREAGVDAPALSVLLTPPATNLQETG
jgi:hypothetical protein